MESFTSKNRFSAEKKKEPENTMRQSQKGFLMGPGNL